MGMMDMPRTPDNDKQRLRDLKTVILHQTDNTEFDTMKVTSTDNPVKQMVFSRQEKSGGSGRKHEYSPDEDTLDKETRNLDL